MKITLREWQSEVLQEVELKTKQEQELARMLTESEIVKIIELKEGLSISTNSFVGSIQLGDIQLSIMPKIQGMELLTLLNYAYYLHDIKIMHQSDFNLESYSFLDIIIYQLYIHTEDLLSKGVHRGYIRREEDLASPKGRLDFTKIARNQALKKATLPSRYYERNEDNLLNQVLLAGLKRCVTLVNDQNLRIHLRRLVTYLDEYISSIVLTRQIIQKAQRTLNRLSERYRPLLEIITLLQENQGIQLDGENQVMSLHGFFFDMNRFFEMLVSKLIREFVPDYTLMDQHRLRGMFTYEANQNPKHRRSPTPRPDIAIMKNNKVVKLMDAKYKDLWEHALPRDMLYQLAIYALSSEGNKTATIIYPSLNEMASTQKINISNPTSSHHLGSVILLPLHVNYVAKCLEDKSRNRKELVKYMSSFV
ncbi:McrC family protein [Bacillus sinesaloumensis]|uniref:McrC family protein n=1 Tax=Litchfieldia sinesaloumensis TaxID=1926280 RepID=UPI001356306D|nr:restriction endonuclease [Bacillus sinesaloumensis]